MCIRDSYSNLNSNIDKDVTNYGHNYDLSTSNKYMNSGEGLISIKILTELWKFKLKRDNIDFEAFHSFSKSFKEDGHYNFDFIERFAYDSTVQNRSISFVQEVAKNDIENTNFNSYNYFKNTSDEQERTAGFNFKFNFKLSIISIVRSVWLIQPSLFLITNIIGMSNFFTKSLLRHIVAIGDLKPPQPSTKLIPLLIYCDSVKNFSSSQVTSLFISFNAL